MGYYTDFNLSVHNADEFDKDFVEFKIQKYLDCSYVVLGHQNAKWYEWRGDMLKVSKLFPNAYFKLTGHGEEPDDVWCAYFKNGKSVVHDQPKWTPPPFNEGDLT